MNPEAGLTHRSRAEENKCHENTKQIRWQDVTVYKRANYLSNLQAFLDLGWHIWKTSTIFAKKTRTLHNSLPSAWSASSSPGHPWCCPQWSLHNDTQAPRQSTQLSGVHKKPGSTENWSLWGPLLVLETALGFDPLDILPIGDLSQQLSNKLNTSSCYASNETFLDLRKKPLN